MTQEELLVIEKEAFEKGLLQFRAFDEYVRKALMNNEIIFGAAKNFNDPFDCNLPIDFKITYEEIVDCIKCSNIASNLSIEEIDKLAENYQQRGGEWNEKIHFLIYEFRRFSCFNININDEVHSNSLFWSNYANHHKGICLKFNGQLMVTDSHFQELVKPLPINYCSKIPEFNYLKYRIIKDLASEKKAKEVFGMGPSEYLLGVKSEDWKHEEEVRFVFKSPNKLPIMDEYVNKKFNPKMLEQIYIGCNASQSTIDDVLKIMYLPKYKHVEVIKLIRDDKEFKLNEEKLK